MSRRIGAKASVANIQNIEAAIDQIGQPFVPRQDPFAELAKEIEKCRKKVWSCVSQGSDPSQPRAKRVKGDNNTKSAAESAQTIPTALPGVSSNGKAIVSGKNRADVEFRVNAMKVVDMREECKRLGLDTKGIKKVLRSRLLKHLLEEEVPAQSAPAEVEEAMSVEPEPMQTVEPEHNQEPAPVVSETVQSNEDVMKMSVAGGVDDEARDEPVRVSNNSTPADEPMHEAEEDDKKDEEELMDGTDYVNKESPVEEHVQNIALVEKIEPEASVLEEKPKVEKVVEKQAANPVAKSVAQDDISPTLSETTSSSASSKFGGNRVREMVSKISSQSQHNSNSNPSGGHGSALSKSVQAKKEARMARMAEMRVKSQQAKTYSSSKTGLGAKDLSTSALGSTLTSSLGATLKASSGKKNLAAQMREKAFRKENFPGNTQTLSASSKTKRPLPLASAIVADSLGNTLKSGLGSTLKYGSSLSKLPKVASPMDTYEISDREDSDSDDSDSDNENEKKKKKIPLWAKKENLVPALEKQYLGQALDGRRVDPDDIFPEVESCNLEAIFGNRKNARYRSRTSSGNWSRDQVTAAEKLVYKRTMGFVEKPATQQQA